MMFGTAETAAVAVAYLLLIGLLLWTMRKRDQVKGLAVKMVLSTVFVAVAVCLSGDAGQSSSFLVCGLVASWVGDLFLGIFRIRFYDDRFGWFCLGVVAFTVAQVCFLMQLAGSCPISMISVALVAVAMVGFVVMNRGIVLKNRYAAFSMIYSVAIMLVLIQSIVMAVMGDLSMQHVMFTVGMALFILSDIVLFDLVFKHDRYTLEKDYVNKSSYFIGQLIIAFSVMFL